MKNLFYFLCCCIFTSCISTQTKIKRVETPIATQKLLKDISYVQHHLKKIHPDLYWYISEEALDFKFDSLRKTIVEPLTPNEFFFKISPIIASVHQGHMQVIPMETSLIANKSKRKIYKKSKGPFSQVDFYWADRNLYILQDKTQDAQLLKGSKVMRINGISPETIYHKYRPTFTSDGHNTTFIDKRFSMLISRYYTLELGLQDSLHLQLSCNDSVYNTTIVRQFKTSPQNSEKNTWDTLSIPTKQLSKAEKKEIKNNYKTEQQKKRRFGYIPETKNYSKFLSFPIQNDSSVAILTVKDFTRGDYKKAYATIFQEIKDRNIRQLALDLRGNLGGRLNDALELYSYLTNEEMFVMNESAEITSATWFPFYAVKGKSALHYTLLSPFYLVQTIALWSKTYTTTDGKKRYRLKGVQEAKRKDNAYTGNLYVFIDGASFSASSLLSANLKGSKRAVFVGEETGGAYNGTVAGRLPMLTLPNSKLRWVLGTMSIRPKHQTTNDGYGIPPDVEIKTTVDEQVNLIDPLKDWLIQTQKRP